MEESDSAKRLSEALSRHIVPLFGILHGKQKLHGTGFLVSSGKSSYLVSAAHVLDRLKDDLDLFFYIEQRVTRKLSGRLHLTRTSEGKDRKSDRLDVGVLELEGPQLPPYPHVDKDAIPIDVLMASPLPRENEQYLLVGFPQSKSKPNLKRREVESEPYGYRNVSKPLADYKRLDLASDDHIAIPFNTERWLGPDGNVRDFPHPNGMSGSPIWLLNHEKFSKYPNRVPIIGIFIEYHKNHRVLIGTHIRFALDMINGKA